MKTKILLLSILFLFTCIYCEASVNVLYVGTSKADITPTEAVHLAGYGGINSGRLTDKVHDKLFCRVTVLKVADKRLILLSSDLVGFFGIYEIMKDALLKKYRLKPEDIFLSSIHTHSGPITTLNEKNKETSNYRYTQKLINKVVRTVGKALKNMKPAELKAHRGYSPIGINRRVMKLNPKEWPIDGGLMKMGRNPKGIVDHEVLVLKVEGIKDDFNCCLYDYACHARSHGYGSKIISGDFIGISEQVIEKILGNGAVASAFAGASGEIDPMYVLSGFNNEPNWTPETELMGTLLGQEVVRTFRAAKQKIEFSEIQSDIVTLHLPGRKRGEYISSDGAPVQDLNITVASIGEVAFIGLGCEASVKIGLKIKDASPFKYNFIITHCNGGAGYLSPKEYYKERGYEVTYSGFGPEAAGRVVKETLKMLYKQHKN
ncbi:MAG: neutral/alkaline non-lysosomal ceramidase N-terminal domain-containing protein [Candidatus Aminicenantes bacterium]|nr:neutral/alkaline non-lysosomal ceramidase N-terminal domain-containing protein [Candidatus Aminicenantes bacterium]